MSIDLEAMRRRAPRYAQTPEDAPVPTDSLSAITAKAVQAGLSPAYDADRKTGP